MSASKMKSKSMKRVLIISLILLLIFSTFVVSCSLYFDYIKNNKMNLIAKENIVLEYGSNKVNLDDIVKKYEGDSIKIVSDVDTSVVGEQVITVEIDKGGIKKDVPITVNILDSKAPVITLKNESVDVNIGDSFDLTSNIESVIDNVDGNINFLSKDLVKEDDSNYYTITFEGEISTVGTHEIFVKAVDKNKNVSEVSFMFNVSDPNASTINNAISSVLYNNLPGNGSSSSIVSLAYSLLGLRYISGGNSLAGFDCSGFVQYVYGQNGFSISRSASTQINDGYGVSYENAMPGDILSWGYGAGAVTHSALYVGNGMMIHAANPSQGVILSNVASWDAGSADHLLSVRRILS